MFAIMASSPPTTTTITATYASSSTFNSIRAAEFSNVSSATPLTSAAAASGTRQGPTTQKFAPSITTGAASLIVVAGYDYNFDNATYTAAGGFTMAYSNVPSWGHMAFRYAAAGTYLGLATNAYASSSNSEFQTVVAAFPKA
jgi:hypothetical protein